MTAPVIEVPRVKVCVRCGIEYRKRPNESRGDFGKRKHCAVACLRGQSGPRPIVLPVAVGPEAGWWERMACSSADPEWFSPRQSLDDGLSVTDAEEARRARVAAERWCARCEVKASCALVADLSRAQGVWGGTDRRVHHGAYKRVPLIAGAPLYDLDDVADLRRAGVTW